MGRRKKTSIEGVMYDGGFLQVKKGKAYCGNDGATYIPRSSLYSKGCGQKIMIVERQIFSNEKFEVRHLTMTGGQFKKLIGLTDEGKVTII